MIRGEANRPGPATAVSRDHDRSVCDRHGHGGVTRSRKDLRYFQERAEQELKNAELADHPDAARAHSLLAGYYLDLVHSYPEAALHPSLATEEERRDGRR